MSDPITVTAEYNELLDSIKQTLAAGQLRAARAVNNAVVETYWQIGREIVIRQREQGWGAKVTERLSADLRTARPDMRGLSARNLRYMAALASRWPHGIEWRRLPAKVRQALPTAEDLRPTVTRTVREIESTTHVALCRPERRGQLSVSPSP